jgi:hypothetical protein
MESPERRERRMPYEPSEIVARYASGATTYANGKALAPDAAEAWKTVGRAAGGPLGSVRLRDSARREWVVEARRDVTRGRILVFSPVHADLEPFRASADGYRPDTHLSVTEADWTLLALLAAGRSGDPGRDDEELGLAAFRVVDRMVREAQHASLLGADDEDDDE